MNNLTKEQLLELLGSGASNEKKSRKKTILDDAKKEAMLLKLADMRKIVATNRIKKKEATEKEPATTTTPATTPNLNVVFEKHYSTQLEKMTDLLNDLNENTKELTKIKKEKLKKRENDLAKNEDTPQIQKTPITSGNVLQTPTTNGNVPKNEISLSINEPQILSPQMNEPKPLVVQQKPSNFIPMYESKQVPKQADILNPPPKVFPNRNMFRKNQIL
jgi:alanyl-tRNA synthetase